MRLVDNRTGLEVLDRDACLRLLATGSAAIGRLALVDGGRPVIFPVNYALDEDRVVFRTASGTKLDGALHDAPVAFEIDHVESETRTGWSVLVRGHARLVTSERELFRLRALPLEPWADGEHPNTIVIIPDSITGRRVTHLGQFFH